MKSLIPLKQLLKFAVRMPQILFQESKFKNFFGLPRPDTSPTNWFAPSALEHLLTKNSAPLP